MSSAQQYFNKLNEISGKFPGVLDEFKRNYVIYNQHPDFQEYANIFSNTKGNLSSINKDLFVLTNNVQQDINKLNENNENLVMELDELEKENEMLKKTLANASGTSNGSEIMNDNAKEQYKEKYIRNLSMIFGNLLIIIAMILLFKK
jgi:hypothetical protein